LTELENPDLMINGCLIFIRNYFTPLSIRQDATAFEDMRCRLFSCQMKGESHEWSSHHIDLAFCTFIGRMCMGRVGTGSDSQFTLVCTTADQSRDR
jgi:hypothetical protein